MLFTFVVCLFIRYHAAEEEEEEDEEEMSKMLRGDQAPFSL
jgi:hypothetical protein